MPDTSLKVRIKNILSDYEPHRSDEITATLFGNAETVKVGLFRLGARVWDVRHDGHKIHGWKDKEIPKLYWYQMERPEDEFTRWHEVRQEPVRKQVTLFPVRRPVV